MKKQRLLTVLMVLAMPGLFAGCNGGEDFSDADIGTDVIQPSPGGGDPLGEDVEAIRVEFVDDKLVGLGYDCRGTSQDGTGYIGKRVDNNGDFSSMDDNGDPLEQVAKCDKEATAMDFFLGAYDTTDEDRDRFHVGTYFLPQNVQQPTYQISPADLVKSPARIEASGANDSTQHAIHLAALLQALDADTNAGLIDIPYAAHEAVTECCFENNPDAEPIPDPAWAYDVYSDFTSAWSNWHDRVEQLHGSALEGFPADRQTVLEGRSNQSGLNYALDRLRAGTYRLVSAPYSRNFITDGEGGAFVPPLILQLPLLVYPDGRVQGMGYAADVNENNNGISGATLVALESGSSLDRQLWFRGGSGGCEIRSDCWPLSEVLDTGDGYPAVDLELSGRLLGISLYYGVDGPFVTGTDYDVDFPQSGTYAMNSGEGGRYHGTGFDSQNYDRELLQGSVQGIAGVDPDETLYGSSNNLEFYQLRPWKACSTENTGFCQSISDNHPEESRKCNSGDTTEQCWHNYARYLDGDTSDDSPGLEVMDEQPKPATGDGDPNTDSPADDRKFNVQILDNSGYILTDLDKDCVAASEYNNSGEYYEGGDPNNDREYRVGFVTRTEGDSSSGSVNIVVHMTGPASLKNTLPHYGLRASGRIDFETANKELYRTGDTNFGNGVRAQWLDQAGGGGYAYKLYEKDNGGTDALSESQKQERNARLQGALEGVKVDPGNSCTPVSS